MSARYNQQANIIDTIADLQRRISILELSAKKINTAIFMNPVASNITQTCSSTSWTDLFEFQGPLLNTYIDLDVFAAIPGSLTTEFELRVIYRVGGVDTQLGDVITLSHSGTAYEPYNLKRNMGSIAPGTEVNINLQARRTVSTSSLSVYIERAVFTTS